MMSLEIKINCYQIMIQNNEPLKELIRYEEQLRGVSQQIELSILENSKTNIKSLIAQQEQLIKYLEIQCTRLNPQSKQIYLKNITRFKKKAKEHRDYLFSNYGKSALPAKSQETLFMEMQKQNMNLVDNKLGMYENERMQNEMGGELHSQGRMLEANIDRNQRIRGEIYEAEGSVQLIKRAIMKRKIMFCSLIVLFVISFIGSLIIKNNGKD